MCIAGVGKDGGIYVDVEFWYIENLTDAITTTVKTSYLAIHISVTSRQAVLH
jgi:hypothetical protein